MFWGIMKGKNTLIILTLFFLSLASGQLVSDLQNLETAETMHLNLNRTEGLSIFDPDRFDIHHGFSMSMMSMGGLTFSVGSYTNQMSYWINDNLRLDTDITLLQPMMGQPLTSQNSLFTGDILYNTRLTYRPSENSIVSFSFGNNAYSSRRLNSPFSLRAF